MPTTEVPASFVHLVASATGTGGAVMFGAVMLPNAEVVRDRIQPSTMARSPPDVVFELINQELLIIDCALDKIAD